VEDAKHFLAICSALQGSAEATPNTTQLRPDQSSRSSTWPFCLCWNDPGSWLNWWSENSRFLEYITELKKLRAELLINQQ